MNFTGQTALVTGAGRNIGRSVALAFAENGIDVAVGVNRQRDEGEAVADEVRNLGAKTVVVAGDVSNVAAVETMVNEAVSALGPIDYLVHTVAARPRQDILGTSNEDWDDVIRLILSSSFYLAKLVLPGMKERGFGRITYFGGSVAVKAMSHRPHVVAAKHGLVGLTKAVAAEFGHFGVTANLVSPGITDTSRDLEDYPNWPPSDRLLEEKLAVPRLGTPDEIASLCLFLASDEAAYITGQHVHCDGGITITSPMNTFTASKD